MIERVGPLAIVGLHALWERSTVAADLPAPIRELTERYTTEYVDKLKTPADRRYQEVHKGHLIYIKPEEECYLNDPLIRTFTLTGTGEELIARLKALEAAGLKQVAIQIVINARETMEEFSREVIAKY